MPSVAQGMRDVIADTVARTRQAVAPAEAGIREAYTTAVMEKLERELAPFLRGFWSEVADDPDAPEHFRAIAREVTQPGHQAGLLIQLIAMVPSVFALANAVAMPLIQQFGQGSWRSRPSMVLSPAELALAVVRGALPEDAALEEALLSGYDGDRFRILELLAGDAPGVAELLSMVRRGVIDEERFQEGVAQGRMRTEWTGELLELLYDVVQPAQAVQAAVQGVKDYDEAKVLAQRGGVDPKDFDLLYQVAGDPPGFTTALELWRRGEVDEAFVAQVIRESRTKTKYVDKLLALRYDLPSASQAVDGAVQGALDDQASRHAFARSGADPADYDWLYAVHGNPVATGEALELLNRGLMSEEDVRQVIRESRTKTKYTDQLLQLRYRLPPMEQTIRLVTKGVWTTEEGAANLRALGFKPDLAGALVALANSDQQDEGRALAKSEVEALFNVDLIPRATAQSLLESLGYHKENAAMLLDIGEARKARAKLDRNINIVRARYIGHKLTRSEASAALDRVGVVAASRDLYVAEWDALRAATTRELSEAQLAEAVRNDLIDFDTYQAKLVEFGYSDEDAAILRGNREAQLGRRKT